MGDRDIKLRKGKGDIAHSTVKATLSAVPVFGGPLAELFDSTIAAPLARRRDEWLEDLMSHILELLDRVESLEEDSLANDDQFLSIAMQATAAALKTHEVKKRVALRNAVLNSAAGQSPDDAKAMMFIGWIDQFTEWHVTLLSYIAGPKAFIEAQGGQIRDFQAGSRAHVAKETFPELPDELLAQVIRDLHARGLSSSESLGGMVSGRSMYDAVISSLGREFLSFISEPAE